MKKRKNKKKELTLKEATLMDDEFMKNIFIYDSSIPEMLIKTVMEEIVGETDLDFDSSSIRVERLMQNSFGHSSRYDYFEKANGFRFILELQRNKYQFTPKRSRFYFSLADALSLKKGESYEQLDEIYQIVFSDGDIFNDNLAVGHYVMIEKDTHRILDNGIHLIHINCSHPDFPEKYKKIKL